jgi:hypothetical protein
MSADRRVFEVLRIAAAMCFIGHGAFGLIGKAGWVVYFGVAGIGPGWAYSLMPIVGFVDILMGISVLVWPTKAVCAYMAFWGLWTAMLRPLAGQGVAECLERAGNYGVPLALLLVGWAALPRGGWFARMTPPLLDAKAAGRVAWVLRVTTATLLLGHGLLAATGKPLLLLHLYNAGVGDAGLSTATMLARQGGFEIALAMAVLLSPGRGLLLFVFAWKIGTELLFPLAGDRVWEFIERGGSYGAPLALMLLTRAAASARAAKSLWSAPAPAYS